jgi:hypothetical protein
MSSFYEFVKERYAKKSDEILKNLDEIYDYILIDTIAGHLIKRGSHSGTVKNEIYKFSNSIDEIYVIDLTSVCVIICEKGIEMVKSHVWTYNASGKIITVIYTPDKTTTTMRTILCDKPNYYINENMFDHRLTNIAELSDTDKRQRKDTKALPDELLQFNITTLPKYVIYEYEKARNRDFLYIKGHPKLNGKKIYSSRSIKVPLIEKYHEIISKLEKLNIEE